MLALVDDREPKNIQMDLKSVFQVKVARLDTADILVATPKGICLIERKTPGDFLNSIGDGRLINQTAKMLEVCSAPIFIIEGDVKCNREGKVVADGRSTRWGYWSYQGMVLSLQLSGALVINVPSRLFAQAAYRSVIWFQKESHMSQRRTAVGLRTTYGQQVDALAAFPHIGEEKASQLLDTFGNLWNTISSVPEWDKVPGIGKKTVEDVIRFMDFSKKDNAEDE